MLEDEIGSIAFMLSLYISDQDIKEERNRLMKSIMRNIKIKKSFKQ